MRKKGFQTNPKDARNAEKPANKKDANNSLMPFAQNAERKRKSPSNRLKAKKFFAETASKKNKIL